MCVDFLVLLFMSVLSSMKSEETSSIVGASSLVTKNKVFPPRSLIMGSPAKVVRALTDEEVEELYASAARYVAFKNEYL